MQVFELIEDVDKMCKSLINLANLCELQVSSGKGLAGYYLAHPCGTTSYYVVAHSS